MNDNEKYIEEFVRDIRFDSPDEKHRDALKRRLLSALPKHRQQPTAHTVGFWRIVMNRPFIKLAAAAVIIIAVLIGINPFGGGVTFADAIKPILSARSVIFDFIVGDEETSPVIHQEVAGSRIRQTISNLPNMTSIIDLENARLLSLDTETKTATYVNIQGELEQRTKNYIEFVRQVLMKLKDSPDVERLGKREIDGRKAIGFVARGANEEVKIWADPKTAVPVRVELRLGQLSAVLKNFEFDAAIDDSQVSMEVPEGYTLEESKVEFSGASEADFIESLRIWADVMGDGEFPEAIGTQNAMKQVPLLGEKLGSRGVSGDEGKQVGMKFIRGMLFFQVYETGSEWHYGGKGVKLGDGESVVLWYRPKGSQSCRVIHGDLSVKDVAPEDLPK